MEICNHFHKPKLSELLYSIGYCNYERLQRLQECSQECSHECSHDRSKDHSQEPSHQPFQELSQEPSHQPFQELSQEPFKDCSEGSRLTFFKSS